jgi:hypothetical protein
MDFELPNVKRQRRFDGVLRLLRLDPAQIDLVVDEEFTYNDAPGYSAKCAMIPYLAQWRSFTVISGDFPADLQDYERGQIHPRPRRDWQRWYRESRAPALPRLPRYGDYTVQYAAYRPPPIDQVPRPSISVRYTVEENWLICRGEAQRENGPGTEQWIGWAQLLASMPEFKGGRFSAGDYYIEERIRDGASHGNFTSWISAGINHHVTLAARQVANLCAA